MKADRLTALLATGITALIAAIAIGMGAPQVVRVLLGVPLVLVLPGFATVCALLPVRDLSRVEVALASLGASVGITVGVSTLLAATPIGLSTRSAAVVFGVGTAGLALYAWRRTRGFLDGQEPSARGEAWSRPDDRRTPDRW